MTTNKNNKTQPFSKTVVIMKNAMKTYETKLDFMVIFR
jgi:hypothetical protein